MSVVTIAREAEQAKQHDFALKKGLTCIDCHKGITHKPMQQFIEQKEEPASFDVN